MGEVCYKVQNSCECLRYYKRLQTNSNISPSLYKGMVHGESSMQQEQIRCHEPGSLSSVSHSWLCGLGQVSGLAFLSNKALGLESMLLSILSVSTQPGPPLLSSVFALCSGHCVTFSTLSSYKDYCSDCWKMTNFKEIRIATE